MLQGGISDIVRHLFKLHTSLTGEKGKERKRRREEGKRNKEERSMIERSFSQMEIRKRFKKKRKETENLGPD